MESRLRQDSEQYNRLKLGVTICLSHVAQNCKKLAAMSSLSVSLCFTTSVLDFCRRRPAEGLAVVAWL